MNKTKMMQIHTYREQTGGHQWGEGMGRGNMGWGKGYYRII